MQEAIKISDKEISKFHLRCGSNYCPYCFHINSRQLTHKIYKICNLNNLHVFVTLTLDPKTIPEDQQNNQHKYLTSIFNHFITDLRHFYPDLKYIWVSEFQSLGSAHMHMVVNRTLDIFYMRKTWVKLGGGKQMKIEDIKDIASVSHYLAKYLSKTDTGENKFYYQERRYGVSRNCLREGSVVPVNGKEGD
jgi:hypothetical protein